MKLINIAHSITEPIYCTVYQGNRNISTNKSTINLLPFGFRYETLQSHSGIDFRVS